MNQRKQWMAFYARTDAAVEVDAGAVDAMLHQGRSLLSAGVKALEGDFEVGQVVEVYSQADHRLIGKGGQAVLQGLAGPVGKWQSGRCDYSPQRLGEPIGEKYDNNTSIIR